MLVKKLQLFCLVPAIFLAVTPGFARADANADLIYKVALGDHNEIQAILDKGADPATKDEKGTPAINIAASRGNTESVKIVETLMKAGADVNARDARLQTPLMQAIITQNVDLVYFLLSNGADFYASDIDGKSVKSQAEWIGNAQIKGLIDEALKQDADRTISRSSKDHMYELLDQFIYYSCASQYLVQARAVQVLDHLDEDSYNKRYQKLITLIGEAQTELEYTFKMDRSKLAEMLTKTREMIADDLVVYSSRKSAERAGIGQETDLDKRCQKQVLGWREGFARSEAKRLADEAKDAAQDQQKESKRQMKEYQEQMRRQQQENVTKQYEEYYRESQDAKGLALPKQQ